MAVVCVSNSLKCQYIKELDQRTSEVSSQFQNAKCQPKFDLYLNTIYLV